MQEKSGVGGRLNFDGEHLHKVYNPHYCLQYADFVKLHTEPVIYRTNSGFYPTQGRKQLLPDFTVTKHYLVQFNYDLRLNSSSSHALESCARVSIQRTHAGMFTVRVPLEEGKGTRTNIAVFKPASNSQPTP